MDTGIKILDVAVHAYAVAPDHVRAHVAFASAVRFVDAEDALVLDSSDFSDADRLKP